MGVRFEAEVWCVVRVGFWNLRLRSAERSGVGRLGSMLFGCARARSGSGDGAGRLRY